MDNYEVKIRECSKETTARERIMLRDTSNTIRLDEATKEQHLIISPEYYAILDVHNEKADHTDYSVYIVVDTAGNKYMTSSESFWKSFIDIFDEMATEVEPYQIEVYRLESKNYKGKEFITCSLI